VTRPGPARGGPRVSPELAAATVLDAEGGVHRLGELWDRKPAVLAMLRHFA
jgi:hypothetical protein